MARKKKQLVRSEVEGSDENRTSSSPELGYQGEICNDTNDVASSNPMGTVKKRGPRISVTNDDTTIYTYLEDKITNAFETAYNSMCETVGNKHASEILLEAYSKVEEQSLDDKSRIKTVFFQKIQYRLSFMIESMVSLDNRRKVFLFIARFSVNQWRNGVADFMEFLTDFCTTLCHCEDATVRLNVCTLVGFLLKGCGNNDNIDISGNAVSIELRRKLYAVLIERQLDKVIAVRAEVIQSVADIQDDEIPSDFIEAIARSPKDVILMGFRDVAADCRLTAVFALHIVVPAHSDYLIELVASDSNVKVRIAAIRQLANLPLTFLTEQQRMGLLRALVLDNDISVKDAVQDVLLSEWLSFIHRMQERRNKRRSRVQRTSIGDSGSTRNEGKEINGDELSHVTNDLRDTKCDHGMGSAAQGLLAMLDFCDDPEAEYLCRSILFSLFDVIRQKLDLEKKSLPHFISSLVSDNTFPEVLSTHNYRTLLDKSLSKTDQAQYAFFWRVLIEYCCKRAQEESECIECVHMLTPPLHLFCDLVERMRVPARTLPPADTEHDEVAPTYDIEQVAVFHLLGILRHLDRKDLLGMNEWKSLLLSLLRDDSFSKELTDCIMIDLVEIFFEGKPEQFLATVCDVTFEAIQHAEISDGYDENTEPSTPRMHRNPLELLKSNCRIRRFCMQLIHSMLRTGVFTRCTPVLKKVYDEIIVSSLSFKGSQVYRWALEASGILALSNQEIARTVLLEALDAFKNDDEDIKASSMDVVTDLISVYRYKDILSWPQHDGGMESIRSFISTLFEIVISKVTSPLLCMKACECVSKIVLTESIADDALVFADAVACLISRLFHSSTFRIPEVKSCLERFFSIFPSSRRRNQLVMVAAFHELMSCIRKASDDDFVLHIDIVAALNLIVNTTHVSFLQHAPDMELASVQPQFMRELLAHLLHHPSDSCASLYWETASALDLESFSLADLSEMQTTAQNILENVISTAGLKSTVANEAQKFIRNIDGASNALRTRETEDAEREDCLTELRSKTTRTPRFRRKQTPRSTSVTPIKSALNTSIKKRKVKSNVKRSTQQLLHCEKSPSPPPVFTSLITPVARSRPLLSRTAKKNAVSKTRRWLFGDE